MENNLSQSNPTRSGRILRMILGSSKAALIILSFLLLASLNIFTLVSDQVHDAGYNAIKSILATAAGDAVSSRGLSNSPTKTFQQKHTAAEKSYRKMQAKNASLQKSHWELQAKHVLLEKSHKALESRHATLNRKSAKQAATAHRVAKRIAVRSAADITKNVASVPATITPFFLVQRSL